MVDAPDTNFELQYELPEYKVFVHTDKFRMEQVLDNLLVNAKKNVQPGGILRLSLKEEKGILNFSIYNQCFAIPEETLSKIWTKFYRDHNSKYMQNLDYGVKNVPDGVLFYFSIPTIK